MRLTQLSSDRGGTLFVGDFGLNQILKIPPGGMRSVLIPIRLAPLLAGLPSSHPRKEILTLTDFAIICCLIPPPTIPPSGICKAARM